MQALIAFLAMVCFLLSCRSSRPVVATVYPATVQESFVNVPVKIYAVPFIQKMAQLTPPEITSPGWPAFLQASCDFRYKYRFIRSGVQISVSNNQATITLSGNYQLAGSKCVCAFGRQVSPWVTGSCGFNPEPMRRVEVSVRSALQFLPGYTMKSLSAVDRINPVDRCTVTLLNTDITGQVTDAIRSAVNSFTATLDQSLAKLTFPELLQTAGSQLGSKIPLNDYGYMKVNPSAVSISPLNYGKDTLYLTVGVACYPEITSDSANREPVKRLPPLNTHDLRSGFTVNMNAAYDYGFINSHLNSMVQDALFKVRGNTFRVRDIAVRGLQSNKVELKISFGGSKSGTIYLTGTPVLDVQHQIVSLPDLDFTLQSRNLLLTLGKTFLNKKIIRRIREKAVLQTGEVFRENRMKLDSVLNRSIAPNAYTTGNIYDAQLTGLLVRQDQLQFQMQVTGMLNVIVTGP